MSSVILVCYVTLSFAMLIALYRLIVGPSLPDRVVSLELIAALLVGFIAIYVVDTGATAFLDVAIVLALVSFIAAIGMAHFLERGGHRDD